MTWDAYNHRKMALRDALSIADRRRESVTVTDLLAEVDSIGHAFSDEAELLLDAQMHWYQALSGRTDRVLTFGADDLEAIAIQAWQHVARSMPGARTLLDANVDHRELQIAFSNEHEFLARAAGVPANHPHLARHGARIKETARSTVVYEPYSAPREVSFFARFRGPRAA